MQGKQLSIKLCWGAVALDAKVFSDDKDVFIGHGPRADIQLDDDQIPNPLHRLATANGLGGYLIHLWPDAEFSIHRAERDRDSIQLSPSHIAMQEGDKADIRLGQLSLRVQVVKSPRPVLGSRRGTRNRSMTTWWTMFFIVALGLWAMIQTTPSAETMASDYLKDPARFSRMLMPLPTVDKKSFQPVEDTKKPEKKYEGKRTTNKSSISGKRTIPREKRQAHDRKVATSSGILELLKKHGGGAGKQGGSVFGGTSAPDLDAQLEALSRTASASGNGFGGIEMRGGPMGGGAPGIGIGGRGGPGGWNLDADSTTSLNTAQRGKANVTFSKKRSRIIGGLSQKVVGTAIHRYWAQFKFCYERELGRRPNLYGKVTTTFVIDGSGRVDDAQTMASSMGDANVEGCLLRVIRRIRFPKPRGGGQVIVTYPFLFTTAGQ